MNIYKLLDKNLHELCQMADRVRVDNVGDVIHIRALLEISNRCYRNCEYCGIRADNNCLSRYTMGIDEIEALAKKSFDIGYKTVVLQSGENNCYDINKFADMVARLTDYGIVVTLSLGEMSYGKLKLLRDAGAMRYLLKFETADSNMYAKLHKGYALEERLECLSNIKSLGYEVGSGFLIGLPNENIDTIASNLELVAKFECDMVGVGVFIPHINTPLAELPFGDVELAKKCIAITRLLLPKCNIPITTSIGEHGDKYQMFSGGANVIMQNITPQIYAEQYQIYPKKNCEINLNEDRRRLEDKILSLGRKFL